MAKNYTSNNRVPTTKKERREAAREKARQIQVEEARRAKRNKILTIIGIAAVVLVVLIAVISIVSGKKSEESAPSDWEAPEVSVKAVTEDDLVTGYQIVGAAEPAADAPRVDLYFDYLCSHCVDLEAARGAELAALANNGKAQVVLHPVAILGQEFSADASAAFHEVATKDPDHLLAFHKAVFDHAEDLMKQRTTEVGGWDKLADLAEQAGVPADIAKGLEANADLEWVTKVSEHFLEDYRGTPTVLVNGEQNYEWPDKSFEEILGLK